MPNPYFRFKRFTVVHDRCAMKVGTDGVLLGAWVDVTDVQTVLEIGTGSGLIALMLAQRISDTGRSTPSIDGVEVDHAASQQAAENVGSSPWADRIRIHHAAIQSYAADCRYRYDLIVSNPPFFNHAIPGDSSRAVARHTQTLTAETLLEIADRLLVDEGRLCLIYPVAQAETLMIAAPMHNFVARRILRVRPTPSLPVKRVLIELVKSTPHGAPPATETSTIALELARHTYTPEFIALIRDFYLKY